MNTDIELMLFALTLANIITKNVQCWPFGKLHRATVTVKISASVPQAELGSEPTDPLFVESPFCCQDRRSDLNRAVQI